MTTSARRTTAVPSTQGRRGHAVLHRGDATVEVLYTGPDCVTVAVTRAPEARRAAEATSEHLAAPPGPTNLDPHVRAVLDVSGVARGKLLAALDARLGADVAGIVLDQRGAAVVVTLDLLPTRRARPHTGPSRPRATVGAA